VAGLIVVAGAFNEVVISASSPDSLIFPAIIGLLAMVSYAYPVSVAVVPLCLDTLTLSRAHP
jgi:hypothetical protein